MKEDIKNIAFVPQHLASKPGSYVGKDPNSFLGKFVKMGFPGINPLNQLETIEHMWVHVEAVEGDDLVGSLDNDPILSRELPLHCGSTVRLTVDLIEDVLE